MEPPLHTLTLMTIYEPLVDQGLIQRVGVGCIGWLATPLGCAVSIILISFFEHSLVNKVYDETQINHSDRD